MSDNNNLILSKPVNEFNEVTRVPLSQQVGKQFVVYNPSASITMYLSVRYPDVAQLKYEFIVNPNRYFVSPVFDFVELFYTAVGIVLSTDHIRPTLYVYSCSMFNPYLVTLP